MTKENTIKMSDEVYTAMMATIKFLNLDSKNSEIVYEMCNALFNLGVTEGAKAAIKQVEEVIAQKAKKKLK